jgi:very-short-patch-repair endonuclease
MPEARDLLHKLLDYIVEQAKDIDPRGYTLDPSKGYLWKRESIVGLPGVEFDLKVEGDHIWLRVPRLRATKPPNVPKNYQGVIRYSSDPDGPHPELDETAFLHLLNKVAEGKTPQERDQLEARGRTAVAKVLESYTPVWKSWADGERPLRRTIALYSDLFALKHQIEAEETARPQELVWGIGIASWQLQFEGKPLSFEYPLLTQAVEIVLDEQTMVLDIRPRAMDTRVEMDAFIACQVPGAADVEHATREYLASHTDRPVTPFDLSSFSGVLKLAVTNLDSKGSYREVMTTNEPVPAPGENLVVTDAWVLLSRPRLNNYLIEDIKRLQKNLATRPDIPLGPLSLVSSPSNESIAYEPVRFRGISSRGHSEGQSIEELFFPLPYNEEQVTIVQRLERAPGVTVQGPPGTGKTHTIANIICHYLATGRRVLVTSRGETALEVLQAKIPEEVRSLTISLLSGDREGVRQFQASIAAIQHRVSQLNPGLVKGEIDILKGTIDRTHAELSSIDRRIDAIAVTQLSEVQIDGTPMRAQKLAEDIVSGREKYGWFDDALSLSQKHAPPLSEDEAGKLREARRKLGNDLVYVAASIPSADDLPLTATIADLHNVFVKKKDIENEVARGEVLSLKTSSPEILKIAHELLVKIGEAKALAEELESFNEGWPLKLRVNCRLPSFETERKALEALLVDIESLKRSREEFLKRPVEFPNDGFSSQKTVEAINRGAKTGKPFGPISIGTGEAKQHIVAIRIAGLPPMGTSDWMHVQRYIKLQEKVVSFCSRWNKLADVLSVPRLSGGIVALRSVVVTATIASKAHKLAVQYDAVLSKKAELVFDKPPIKELIGTSADLESVQNYLSRNFTHIELAKASTQHSVLHEKIAGKTGPVSDALRVFIEKDIGNSSLPSERVAARYVEIIAELRRIAGLSNELSLVRDYSKRIEAAGASKLAARIHSEVIHSSGEDKVFPSTWRQAWNWARIRSYLDNIEAREELQTLAARRQNLEAGLARLYREMVAKAAWLATRQNATPKVLQALAGYATAIRKIGQGTGPNATRYRRDAREAMLDAAGAVPCWIMNHARISETMPADIGAFDLVIVDEASQSDLWALPAILRGKKILVVGDDKQVSPDAGFIAAQRIQELKNRFLTDQPYGTEMTPEKSLYDLAARVFASYQVMLREHFRCVPPIIAYSNRVFYKKAILPLRIPKASERIDPPLVDIYVSDGIRDKRDCNEYEALAIADEISSLLKDDHFSKRTIGVISLLGMEQAKYIDTLVRRRCDAAELLRRRFSCGDARTFQGSERDIMFLSVVVDARNCHALSGNLYEQRFNVAASRARDRMYLVRSVNISDLSNKDLRLSLLSHFNKPLVTEQEEAQNLIDRCESVFERQVFSELKMRGYRVFPQVKTGAYRIDMVVEGAGDTRLAIECDGDEYHGPERWQHDMSRQRILERAGWVFWRCFASTWTLRKKEMLSELLDRLSSMGIEPIGVIERAPSLVETRVWQFKESDNEHADALS